MMKKNSPVLLCSLVAVLAATPLHAQSSADKARLDEIARKAAQEFATAKAAGDVQTRPTNPVPQGGQAVELTLDDAVERALDRNLELAVERMNPTTFDLSLARIKAVYRPTLTSQFGQQSRINPPSSTLNGGTVVDNDTTTYNMGVNQSVPWGGGSFTFQFNNNKQVSSNVFNNYNPAFNSNFALSYTQPILRGLTIDGNRQQLQVTTINRDISETQLRGIVATTVANVRNAYWELTYAAQAVDVAKGSLDLAEKLVQDTLRDLPHYANTGTAFAEGYRSIGDSITGDEHYVKWAYLSDGRILDSKHPESLVYEMRNGRKTLVAAMYMLELGSGFAQVPDVGGALTQWHVHNDLCLADDPNDPLRKVVSSLTTADGTCPAGTTKAGGVPMIHVWIVKNACGPFASLEGIGGGQVPPGETRNCDTAHGS